MKKILTTILIFLGLLTVGASIGVNAADETVTFDFYNEAKLSATNGTAVTKEWLNSKITSGTANFVTAYTASGTVQYDKKAGVTTGTGSKSATMNLTFSSEIKKVEIIGAEYDSGNKFTVDGAQGVGTLAAKDTILADVTTSVIFDLASSTNTIAISTVNAKRATIYKLILTVGSTAGQPYSVSFNANGGTFVDGKGAAIENIASGTETSVVLPVAADLSSTPCLNFTTLSGWNDGTTTHEPGASVTVNKGTIFTAEYAAPTDPISIADACKIAESATTQTAYAFVIVGKISEIVSPYDSSFNNISVNITDESGSKIEAFRMKNGQELVVGDTIKVTGSLVNFKGTLEIAQGCTYEMVKPALIDNFVGTSTQSSLKIAYDVDLNPTDVDLRLGGIIAANAYNASATYGVLVVEGVTTVVAGKTEYASVAAFLAANSGFKNVQCTPAQVEGGYQFAWVITDMEGHYNTNLNAVMYMVYNGVLYLSAPKSTSVIETAQQYLNSSDIELTDDQRAVLNKIIAA